MCLNNIYNNNSSELINYNSIVQYDSQVKKILSTKIYLAEILKDVIPEYSGMSRDDIFKYCFEGEILTEQLVDDIKIIGKTNEDNSPGEGKVTYDIKFDTIVPGNQNKIKLLINLEAQKKDKLSYPILKRGNYYTARMISSQKNTIFTNDHYEKICKVYSIWIIMNPESNSNTVVNYHMFNDNIIGEQSENVDNYDLQNIIIIKLGNVEDIPDNDQNNILRFLDTLLSKEIDPINKIDILENKFQIPMTTEFKEEVNDMCNLGEGIYEDGLKNGKIEGKIESIKQIIANMGFTAEQAMAALGIPKEEYSTYLSKIN